MKFDGNYFSKLCDIVLKTIVEALESLTIEDVNMYQLGYNKAIDDFSNEIDKYIERYDGTIYDEAYYTNVKSDFEDLKKIGNQLKAGGESGI